MCNKRTYGYVIIPVPKHKSQVSVYPYGTNHSHQILAESKGKFHHKGVYKEKDNLVIILFASLLPSNQEVIWESIPKSLFLATWPSLYGARSGKILRCASKESRIVRWCSFPPITHSGYGASLGCRGCCCDMQQTACWSNERWRVRLQWTALRCATKVQQSGDALVVQWKMQFFGKRVAGSERMRMLFSRYGVRKSLIGLGVYLFGVLEIAHSVITS